VSNTIPIEKLNKHKRKVATLLDQWTRIEAGLRTGFFPINQKPEGGLSLANDMVDKTDQLRKLLYGTDDMFELGKMFGFKQPKPKRKRKRKKPKVPTRTKMTKGKQGQVGFKITKTETPKQVMSLIRKLNRATSKTEKRQIRASLRRLDPQWLRYRK
jgi:hypothetical protein